MDDEPAPERLIGEVIASRYRIEAHVGDGSMGSVYRARHVKVGRPFAVKVLRPSLTGDPGLRRRFLREAELAGGLHHPGIVGMVDVGETSSGLCYLVMEYAPGDTLYDLILRSAPLPAARVISLVRQLCDGLAHAHDHGLIHRDLKPENVVVEPDAGGGDRLKIIDFGIAILRDEAVSSSPDRLTTAGLVLGTPHYMAPEQALGDPIDHRVDLFALGVMCFEMLTGQAPFDGDGVEVAHANVALDTPAMHDRAPDQRVDPLLEAFTRRLMNKSREARPASAAAARALLDRIERDRAAAAAMLEVPAAAADVRNVLWAPRVPVAIPAAAAEPAAPVAIDPQDERTVLTRAVTPRRALVAAVAAVAMLAAVAAVAMAAQWQRDPEAPATRHARMAAAAGTAHEAPARTVAAVPDGSPDPGDPAAPRAPETARTTDDAAATPPPRVAIERAAMAPAIAAHDPPRLARPTRGPAAAEMPTVPGVAAIASEAIPRPPLPGVALPPAVPPPSADAASVAQLYAAVGQELRSLDRRRGTTADLWPVYLRIRINDAMADRDLREAVDAQLHQLHAQIAKRGDAPCETPPP